MTEEKETAEIVRKVLQLLSRQGICYGDEGVIEVGLDELAGHFAPEFGGSSDSAREGVAAALDRHPEILSKRVREGEVIYETTMGACRQASPKALS
ncbi:MAG: hypothetical protein ACE5LD_02705 [Candidatus Bipolaricaulia bacterium]